jgi:hypothetical protein
MASAGRSAIVVTSDKLSFISPWSTAAVLLVELGAPVFFIAGAAEETIGRGAPWFIVAALICAFLLKSIYLNAGDLVDHALDFPATRAARTIPERAWKVPLLLQYLLLGPVCSLAAAQYIGAGFALLLNRHGSANQGFALAPIAVAVAVLAWWLSRSGGEKYRRTCVRVMQALTIVLVILVVWCIVTVAADGSQGLPALTALFQTPPEGNATTSPPWFRLPMPAPVITGALASFGYALLCLSGLRTLPLLRRYISSPKSKNIRLATNVACGYALIGTGAITLFTAAIVPNGLLRLHSGDALLALAARLAGSDVLRDVLQVLLALTAIMVLGHAVRASILAGASLTTEIFDRGALTSWLPGWLRSRRAISDGAILIAPVYTAAIVAGRSSFGQLILVFGFTVLTGFWVDTAGAVVLLVRRSEPKAEINRFRLAGLVLLLTALSCCAAAMILCTPHPAAWSLGGVGALLGAVALRERGAGSKQKPR